MADINAGDVVARQRSLLETAYHVVGQLTEEVRGAAVHPGGRARRAQLRARGSSPAAPCSIRGRGASASRRLSAACGSLGRLSGGDGACVVVLFVLLVVVLMVAVIPIAERNRPDVTGAEAAPPQLVRAGTDGIVPRIYRLARRQQREMPVAWPAVIREGAEARVACQVARLQGDGAAGRVADQVVAERGDGPSTVGAATGGRPEPGVIGEAILGEDRVQEEHGAACLGNTAAALGRDVIRQGAVRQQQGPPAIHDAATPEPAAKGVVRRDCRVGDDHRAIVHDRPGNVCSVIENGTLRDDHRAPAAEAKPFMMAANPCAILRVTVVAWRVTVPPLMSRAPADEVPKLSAMVLCVIVTVPPLVAMPPPKPAMLSVTALCMRVSVPVFRMPPPLPAVTARCRSP